jgi:hypothetical protein
MEGRSRDDEIEAEIDPVNAARRTRPSGAGPCVCPDPNYEKVLGGGDGGSEIPSSGASRP